MDRREFEPRKLFVGGLPPWDVAPDGLRAHFSRYGRVVDARVILTHQGTGRGFGFVEFEDEEGALRALDVRENAAHNAFFGRRIDVRKAQKKQGNRYMQTQISTSFKNVDLKKNFVGGLRDNITTDDLSGYFEKFGTITDAVVMYEKTTTKARGFGFVTFDSQEAAYEVLKNSFHFIKGTKVETKQAEPRDQNGHYHWSPVSNYGETYSPHNLPFYGGPISILYPYPCGPEMVMNYGYTINQNDVSNDTTMMATQVPSVMYPYYGRSNGYAIGYAMASQSDSKLNANHQIIEITAPIGDAVKSDCNQQKIIIDSTDLASDTVNDSKLKEYQHIIDITASSSMKSDNV